VESSVRTVGVLDKAVGLVEALAAARPMPLGELTASTGLPRATAYRLAVALEAHGWVRRDGEGRFTLGAALVGLGRAAAAGFPLVDAARPVLERLRDETGESVQLFVRSGDVRVCLESLESAHGLRWIVPVGAVLPLDRGSAGRILAAQPYGNESSTNRSRREPSADPVESVEEREPGVASVSAAVRDGSGRVVAAVSVSGPVDRLSRAPARRYGAAVTAAAREIERAAGFGA
jgi:DNA-binding IclR family transcriptional regulator